MKKLMCVDQRITHIAADLPYTVRVAFVSAVATGLVASHMYTAEKKGREGLNIKVLIAILSVFPSLTVMLTPSSEPSVRVVRELSSSSLYHAMEGLGLAMAVHTNMAASGWVTVTVLSVIIGGSGGTKVRMQRHIKKTQRVIALTLNY